MRAPRRPARVPTTTFQPRTDYERQIVESAKAAVQRAYDQGYRDGQTGTPRPVVVDFKV